MMHKFLSKNAATVYHPYQETEIRGFMKRLLVSTERIEDDFRQAAGAIIMRITYGYRVKTADDRFVVLTATANANLMRAGLTSNYLVNTIPALKYVPPWMPGAEWKRDVVEWKEQKEVMVDETFNWTKRNVKRVQPSHQSFKPCWPTFRRVVWRWRKRKIISNILRGPCFQLALKRSVEYLPGIEKSNSPDLQQTVASFMIFVLAMTLFPEVQLKAQAEIDQVIGSDRLPNMQDQESLPYINAIVQEIVRWQPVTPLGMPHRSIQDDVYRGYLIPKGSTILGNVWAITRDPDVYPDPETFNPDRFYNQPTPPAPGFGWGRRICPGQYIAEGSLFIAVASVLAAFTISKARDENGEEIVPSTMAKENSLVYHPASFRCNIKPRSEHHRSLIASV
ncbi:hypothetical protein FRC08_011226 [Ceratobasidium sp. 394]|nr:hypothetical protein FRC08_011226 [Ceratobasidium sp. 394]